MAVDLRAAIRTLGRGTCETHGLDRAAAGALFASLVDGEAGELETGAILLGLRVRGASTEETLGFLDALDGRVVRLALPPELPRPVVLPSYGGARRGANLTPLLALLLARYGVPVLVHGVDTREGDADGDEDATGRAPGDSAGVVSSAQVFAALGIVSCRSASEVESRLVHSRVAYAPLELLAPGLARLVGLRARLGLRSVAHTLVHLLAPWRGRGVRVVGVTHPDAQARMREMIAATGADAMLLEDTEGEPYANPLHCPRIEMYRHGELTRSVEADEGPAQPAPALPAARDAATVAAWVEAALAGEVPIPAPLLQQIGCLIEASREPAREGGPGQTSV
ncbi:MAG: hypothetical protein AMXMBFR42_29220 [Burkholderiales bacterium]